MLDYFFLKLKNQRYFFNFKTVFQRIQKNSLMFVKKNVAALFLFTFL